MKIVCLMLLENRYLNSGPKDGLALGLGDGLALGL